jgi:hypothetical protein
MSKETMTSNERIAAAINLEKPDRVPVVPLLPPEPLAHLSGRTQGQVASDSMQALSGFCEVFDEYGGWDAAYGGPATPVQLQATNVFPMKMRIPGIDTDENDMFQLLEEEVMQPEDYEKICEMGIDAFYKEEYLQRISDLSHEEISRAYEDLLTTGALYLGELSKRDIQSLFFVYENHPFFRLSLMRSLVPFTQDLYYNPEPVDKTLRKMTDDLIAKLLPSAVDSKEMGINSWLFTEERASAFHYPPKIFERFWWPYTRDIVEAFWGEGIATIFHLDTCWDKNLKYFKDLPKGGRSYGP